MPALFCDCDVCERTKKLGGRNIRTRGQALIDDSLLIDIPADTYLHVLRDGLQLRKIYHCLITHGHIDHFYSKELYNRLSGMSHLKNDRPFNIYGSNGVYEIFKKEIKENSRKEMADKQIIRADTACCIIHFPHNIYSTYSDIKKEAGEYGLLSSYDGMEIEF